LLKIIQQESSIKTYYYSFEDEFGKLSFLNKNEFIDYFKVILMK